MEGVGGHYILGCIGLIELNTLYFHLAKINVPTVDEKQYYVDSFCMSHTCNSV
jgi:hypothetical protein